MFIQISKGSTQRQEGDDGEEVSPEEFVDPEVTCFQSEIAEAAFLWFTKICTAIWHEGL